MIQDSLALLLILVSIPAGLYTLAGTAAGARFFRFAPLLVFAYFIPMFLSTLGIIPNDTENTFIYATISTYVTPMCLILLMLSTDIRAIISLGPRPLIMFFASTIGVSIGCILSFVMFKHLLPDDSWKAFAALAATWIGGAANMTAVKDALQLGDAGAAMAGVVDIVLGSMWLTLMIFMAIIAPRVDKWNKASLDSLEALKARSIEIEAGSTRPSTLTDFLQLFAIGLFGVWLCRNLAPLMPEIGHTAKESASTWRVLIYTTYGLLLSFTPLRRLEGAGASKLGTMLLYLLIGVIGAGADFMKMSQYPWLVVAGFVWMSIQALIVYVVLRMTKSPLFYAAVGSQANIGGAASAPMVAAAFHPGFATVGLLLAILGNVLGTYIALMLGHALQWLTQVV